MVFSMHKFCNLKSSKWMIHKRKIAKTYSAEKRRRNGDRIGLRGDGVETAVVLRMSENKIHSSKVSENDAKTENGNTMCANEP